MATLTTVLVVETENDQRTFMSRILSAEEFAVVPAASGSDALRVVYSRSMPVDVLICGLGLPGLDGWEVADRAGARWPVKVLFLYDGAPGRFRCMEGFSRCAFLRRPFSGQELADAVRTLVSEKQPQMAQHAE